MPTDLTPELIVDLPHVGDIQLSAHGMVAYVLGPWCKREEHFQSAIWVVPADSPEAEPRQFTTGEANDRSPRWSPDGGYLAFLSDRKDRGTSHLLLMRATGGEAVPLTHGKKSVAAFAWSPDGTCLAFTSSDDPDEEDERRERERDDPQVFGERWPHARLRVVDRTGGEPRTLIQGSCHVASFCWSPDGRTLACVIRPTPELDACWGDGRIVAVGVEDGTERVICDFTGDVDNLTYDADGSRIYCTRAVDGRPQTSSAVWRVSAAGGELEHIAGGETSCILGLSRPTGAERILCYVTAGLGSQLAWLDPSDGSLETVYAPERGAFHDASLVVRDGQARLAVALSLPDCPAEVFAGDLPGELRRRTEHHVALADLAWGRQEDFHWTAPDGWPMDGILIRPPGSDHGPFPMVIEVHGGPYGRWERGCALSWGDWGQWLAADGYAVLKPNPRGGYGHGATFAAAARADVGGADWCEVLAAVDAAVERGIADPSRLGIGGWSQGGFMTAWAVTQTDRFKAGIAGAGPTEWGWMAATSDMGTFEAELGGSRPWDGPGPYRHSELSPLSFARHVTTPLLILHGEKDERVPLSQATSFHRALREIGAPVEMVIYPREPHGINERNHQLDLLRRVRAWYGRYVK
ncbi:MAG TPA: S9 family peptidase [Chloroflexota bacterium]|nr:S9 family peptidase [Chloroflexota bacterium]